MSADPLLTQGRKVAASIAVVTEQHKLIAGLPIEYAATLLLGMADYIEELERALTEALRHLGDVEKIEGGDTDALHDAYQAAVSLLVRSAKDEGDDDGGGPALWCMPL